MQQDLTMPALVFFDFLCGQVIETIEVEGPEDQQIISMMNVCDHYTLYDEAKDEYFNYTLSKRDGWNAAIYDLNGARRMLELSPIEGEAKLKIEDLNSKAFAYLKFSSPNEPAEIAFEGQAETIKLRLLTAVK